MAKDDIPCCEDIITTKERVKNLAETITEIKEDLDEVKKTLGKNTQKLDDLIEGIKADKALQLKFLFLIITMCAGFGVFLTKSAFKNEKEISELKIQMQYEQDNHTDKGFEVKRTYQQ